MKELAGPHIKFKYVFSLSGLLKMYVGLLHVNMIAGCDFILYDWSLWITISVSYLFILLTCLVIGHI